MSGFLSGGRLEHSPLLGFGLHPLGNFDLKVNQFKCLKYLTVALCIINVNKSLKYCMYVHNIHSSYTTILLVFLLHILIIISKSSSVNNELMSLYIILQCRCLWIDVTLCLGTSLAPCIEWSMQVSQKIVVKTTISACDIIFYHLVCYQED